MEGTGGLDTLITLIPSHGLDSWSTNLHALSRTGPAKSTRETFFVAQFEKTMEIPCNNDEDSKKDLEICEKLR